MPADVGVFSVDDARAMYAAFSELLALGVLDKNFQKDAGSLARIINRQSLVDSVKVFNDSGFVIPPYGLMQISTTVDVPGSKNYIKVKRPIDATLMRSPMLINGPREIEVDGYGTAQDGPVFRLLHDGGTYVAGDRLGAKTGGFSATYGGLYSVIGPDDIGTNIVRVMFDTSSFKGKTKATGLTAGTPGYVYFVDADGTETTREYLAETDVSDIAGDIDIRLDVMYGRLVAYEVC
jgi:hypothetical protein